MFLGKRTKYDKISNLTLLLLLLVGNVNLFIKLNSTNAVLFRIRKSISPEILRSIYFAIFDSYLSYCSLFWAQDCSSSQWIVILQEKAARIINFQPTNSHISPLFKQAPSKNFKMKFTWEIWSVSKTLNNLSPSVFNKWFSFSSNQHELYTG